jgi:hypothetical protein
LTLATLLLRCLMKLSGSCELLTILPSTCTHHRLSTCSPPSQKQRQPALLLHSASTSIKSHPLTDIQDSFKPPADKHTTVDSPTSAGAAPVTLSAAASTFCGTLTVPFPIPSSHPTRASYPSPTNLIPQALSFFSLAVRLFPLLSHTTRAYLDSVPPVLHHTARHRRNSTRLTRPESPTYLNPSATIPKTR